MDQPTRRLDSEGSDPHEPSTCLRCHGPLIEARLGAETTTRFSGSGLYVEQVKGSLLWGPKRTDLVAWMCIECGYTELHAREPRKLLES